tara:strand:+ start:4964 stop:5116 length:153 start_codon:yes stop_codon:yes gene_type:complete
MMDNVCSCCNKKNQKDNFLCEYCGFYMDMTLALDEYFNLPIITNKDEQIN